MEKISNRVVLTVVIVILIAITPAVLLPILNEKNNSDNQGQSDNNIDNDNDSNDIPSLDDPIVAIPTANRTRVYVGDLISFSSNSSSGDIKEYEWSFDDGNFDSKENPTHTFTTPGWYNVTLLIISPSNDASNSSILIGVQRNNIDSIKEHGYYQDFHGPLQSSGISSVITIGPNIGNPSGKVEISISRAIGSIEIIIDLIDLDNASKTIFVTDSQMHTGSDYYFEYEIKSDQIPIECQLSKSKLWAIVMVDGGAIYETAIRISLTFPLDM